MSDALSRSHDAGRWKRSTASSCIRTMKFSRFIAATSRWSAVVNAPASAASGSRSGTAWTLASNRTRDRNSRAPRGTPPPGSMPSGCSRKKSKLKQKSKTRKSRLSSPGPNSPGHRRVPRPIICQNLIRDQTGLKKTRLATSGTSTPVSSMSTEIAMCGALSLREKSSSRLCGYVA